ncbi:MAG: helix-turn-helix transcriptional regulator [Lachnospiraceae bacterium]|nr:helix-turn-helix transcriptional regulator [Lachnospiraceae bacterium]
MEPKKNKCGGDRRSKAAKAGHINHVGNTLWEYRVMRGLTQKELSQKMYVSQQHLSDMECGKRKITPYAIEYMRNNP